MFTSTDLPIRLRRSAYHWGGDGEEILPEAEAPELLGVQTAAEEWAASEGRGHGHHDLSQGTMQGQTYVVTHFSGDEIWIAMTTRMARRLTPDAMMRPRMPAANKFISIVPTAR